MIVNGMIRDVLKCVWYELICECVETSFLLVDVQVLESIMAANDNREGQARSLCSMGWEW